ncbi:MAG: hypothetical protein WC637_11310 [Victivallales bacterium]|jgi:hypothetical protein
MKIKTIHLVPHAHTDIGYTHDPVVVWELHDRFLDQAIKLCNDTRDLPESSRFRWTIEVFATLEHWFENRNAKQMDELLEMMRAGRIDVGGRRFNGTFLSTREDFRWELDRAAAFSRKYEVPVTNVIQNDVNGFPVACAEEMAARGMDGLLMGLNTTLGLSPFPRPAAFRWSLPSGKEISVYHGWIYNRLKSFIRLDSLAKELPAKLGAVLGSVPDDYPFDFLMMTATENDNVGPFPKLSEQVQLFNELGTGVELRIDTMSSFMKRIKDRKKELKSLAGDWPDPWVFGHGSHPQEIAVVRRAQRRLAAVEQIRNLGWANETGGTLSLDRARSELAVACEHTDGSHSSSGEPDSYDTQRQWAQIRVNHWNAESISMGLLRDHLAAIAKQLPAQIQLRADQTVSAPGPAKRLLGLKNIETGDYDDKISKQPVVLLVNPFDVTRRSIGYSQSKFGALFAQPDRPEHLYQFDREPTFANFAKSGDLCSGFVEIPPRSKIIKPLLKSDATGKKETLSTGGTVKIENEMLSVVIDPVQLAVISLTTKCDGRNWAKTVGQPIIEHPLNDFQVKDTTIVRDPSDAAWNPKLAFRRDLAGKCVKVERVSDRNGDAIVLEIAGSEIKFLEFRLNPLFPDALEVTAQLRLSDSLERRALYLTFDLDMDATAHEFHYDSCGIWRRVGKDQIPGTCKSLYESASGAAVSTPGLTVHVAAPDSPLWQFGDFTFGDPARALENGRGFAASWIYNNYWFVNFPACNPGGFIARYRIRPLGGDFNPADHAELMNSFDHETLTQQMF